MNSHAILDGLRVTLPELLLAGAILVVIVADLTRLKKTAGLLALLGLALAGIQAFKLLSVPAQAVYSRAYAVDGLSSFFKLTFIGAAFLSGILSIPAIRGWQSGKGEFFALLLSCTFGMLLMSSANDLLLMYLSLEFVSITSYILAGLLRKNRKSAEASLKYIIYGAAASGFMIYGMTFLYGLTGTLNIADVGRELARLGPSVPPTLTLITSVLIMAGFGYKIAAVPFHMWCPDVYEGAPTPVTAFFSVGPKAAGFAMLLRFVMNLYPAEGGAFEWKLVVALLAVLTMAVGNFGAIHQQNLKRLLAYSSIAHAGYLLIAFNALSDTGREGIAALLVYLFIYVVMNLGAFLVVLVLEERYGVETVDGCRGIGWRAPGLGALMTIFMVSLTGLPPTAGYTGKFLLFSAVIEHGLGPQRQLGIALVVIAVFFSVISLFYYMRIVAAMYLGKVRESDPTEPVRAGAIYSALVWLMGAGTLLLGLWWAPLQSMAEQAAKSIVK
jgi:NADH-quinone oxidoreductase subunit N